MSKDNMEIYCKFDKTKPDIEKVICKIFCDYAENKNIEKNNSHIGQSKVSTLN